jgi:hypothetical protein
MKIILVVVAFLTMSACSSSNKCPVCGEKPQGSGVLPSSGVTVFRCKSDHMWSK